MTGIPKTEDEAKEIQRIVHNSENVYGILVSLDDKAAIQPKFSLWCASGQPWLRLPEEVERFAGYPDGLIG